MSNCVSSKLTSSSSCFGKWKIINVVETHGLTRVLDGTTPAPPKTKSIAMNDGSISTITNPLYELWKTLDRLLNGRITSTLSNEVRGHVLRLNNLS